MMVKKLSMINDDEGKRKSKKLGKSLAQRAAFYCFGSLNGLFVALTANSTESPFLALDGQVGQFPRC
jgi:hypothetical protein